MYGLLSKAAQKIDSVSHTVGMVACWLTIVMMIVILIETIGRYFFKAPTIWSYELRQMLWGCYILFAGSYVLRHDAHVRFDVLYRKLSPRKLAIVNSFTELLFFLFCIAILWRAVPFAWESFLRNEHNTTVWGPPVWPIKMVIPVAVFLLLVQGSARYARNLYTAITGRQLK